MTSPSPSPLPESGTSPPLPDGIDDPPSPHSHPSTLGLTIHDPPTPPPRPKEEQEEEEEEGLRIHHTLSSPSSLTEEAPLSPPHLPTSPGPSHWASPLISPHSFLPFFPSIRSSPPSHLPHPHHPPHPPPPLSLTTPTPHPSPTSDPPSHQHRFSIVIDPHAALPPLVEGRSDDDNEDEDQPGSLAPTPRSHRSPSPSPISPSSHLPPQHHSLPQSPASFSFSYVSSEEEAGADGGVDLSVPSVSPPVGTSPLTMRPVVADRYSGVGEGADEDERKEASEKMREEAEDDEEEDDISKVISYHTVKKRQLPPPVATSSLSFESNPLAQAGAQTAHVIDVGEEQRKEVPAEVQVEEVEDERQRRRREKEERKARRAARRLRRAQRAQQQAQAADPAEVGAMTAAPAEESARLLRASQSRMIALATAGMDSERKESPSVFIDVSDVQVIEEEAEEETEAKKQIDLPSIIVTSAASKADEKRSLRDQRRRPAKLNIPPRSTQPPAVAVEEKSPELASPTSASSAKEEKAQPHRGSFRPNDAVKEKITAYKTVPKQSLRQLVAVAWLPAEPTFPPSKQSRSDPPPVTDPPVPFPVVSESAERVQSRRDRAEEVGLEWKGRAQWLAAHKWDTRTEIDDARPARFKEAKAQRGRGGGGGAGGGEGRVVGRESVMRLDKAKQAHLYSEVILIDDGRPVDAPLLSAVNSFTSCTSLTINDTKVTHTKLHLPSLTALTLSNNKIASLSTLTHLTQYTPALTSLTVINQPLNSKLSLDTLPPLDHDVWRLVLLPLQTLRYFNTCLIDPPSRYAAYQYAKQPKLRGSVSMALWEAALNDEPTVKAMGERGWDPLRVREVKLMGQSLLALHCSPLASCAGLTSLNVSGNHLTSLQHTGLHLLTALTHLDLSDNELHAAQDCVVFGHLPSLRSLVMKGNEGWREADVRLYAIYCCRWLKGTQTAPGLHRLDRDVVTAAEKVRAVDKFERVDAGYERWRLLCAATYTQAEWVQHPTRITVLSLPSASLTVATAVGLTSLISIDLSHNGLTFIDGLDTLPSLRFIDLSHNPDLNLRTTLHQLGSLHSLEAVHCLPSDSTHRSDHHQRVVTALFPSNPNLAVVDGRRVEVGDYVAAMKRLNAFAGREDAMREYQVHLHILSDLSTAATPPRSYSIDTVKPGVQWQATEVAELQLPGLALDEFASIISFRCLTFLNLSHNRLQSVSGLHLPSLPALKWVDLRSNRLKDTPLVFAGLLTQCREVRGVMVAGNPCASEKRWRAKVIDHLPALITIDSQLQLLDAPITIDERVTAYTNSLSYPIEAPSPSPLSPRSISIRQSSAVSIFSSSNQPPSKLSDADALRVAQFRFLLCLQFNLPQSASFHLVKELILVDQRLTFIDFRPFPLLEKLFLGRNELTALKDSNIDGCKGLRVLDVRSNRLRELSEVIELIAALPVLEYIGARDNKFKEGAKYRNHLILGMVSRLGHSHCIRFIDDSEVGADEVVTSLVETGEINSVREREVFRFNELIKHKECGAVLDLDLSNCKLQAAEFHRFPHLQRLNISGNAFTDEALLASGLDACEELVELNVQDNALRHTQKVASYCALMPRLTSININGNPLMTKEDRPRRLFLSFYPTLLDPTFILHHLSAEPVTIEERINAFVLAGTREKERNPGKRRTRSMGGSVDFSPMSPSVRRLSVGEERGSVAADPQSPSPLPFAGAAAGSLQLLPSPYTNPSYALSNDLHFTAEAARFTLTLLTLTPPPLPTTSSLKLKSLALMYIGGPSGILRFQSLRQLDLRNNDIETLEAQGLEGLPHLHTLDLRGNRFHSLQAIVAGLHGCHHLQVLALHRSTRDPSETTVVDRYLDYVFTNLRGLSLCDGYKSSNSLQSSPLSLSALNLLNKLAGIGPNELHEVHLTSVRGTKVLLPFALSALYHLQVPRLRLDGDNEWCMAAEYTDTVIILMGKHLTWLDGVDMSEERRYLALQVNEKRQLDKDRLAWDAVWEEAHERVDHFLKDRHHNDRSRKEAKADNARFFNADIPQMLSVETGAAGAGSSFMTAGSSALSSTLSKIEIVVHFLQVYAINLTQDIHIPWPSVYLNFSAFTSIFSLSFTDLFSLSSDFAQTLLFTLLVVVPMVLLGFFWWFAQLRKKQDYYARRLIEQWHQTRFLALALYMVSLVVAITIGIFAADDGIGFTAMQEGMVPPAESLTVVLLLCCTFTLLFLIWYGIVRKFRRLYMADESEDKFHFRTRWLSMLNWAQILVMFGLTILFMPIARTLLSQFVCECSTDAASGDSACYNQNYPSDACFPSQVTGVQVFAFIFGFVYIVGLPLFYIRLINRTVKLVLSTSRSYQLNAGRIDKMRDDWAAYCAQWKADEKGWSAVQRKKMTKEWRAHSRQYLTNLRALARAQHGIYYSVVNQPENTVPASSLYTSFTYRYRFWKIIQMMEKFVLIIIALFVPAVWGLLQQAKVVSSGVVIGVTAALVISARPYNDLLEDVMDGMAGVSNFINAGVAIALVYELEWLTSERADIILFIANGATMGAFVIAFTVVPLRAWRHAKRDRQREQKEQEGKERERQEREAKREKRHDKAKGRTEAKKRAGGAVAIVSAEEFKAAQAREQVAALPVAYPVASQRRVSGSSLSLQERPAGESLVRGASLGSLVPLTPNPASERSRAPSHPPLPTHRASLSLSQRPRGHSRSASRHVESVVLPAIHERGGDGEESLSPSMLSPYSGLPQPLSPMTPAVGGHESPQPHRRHARAVSMDAGSMVEAKGVAVSTAGGVTGQGRRRSTTVDAAAPLSPSARQHAAYSAAAAQSRHSRSISIDAAPSASPQSRAGISYRPSM